ncbi:cofilin [Desmophyllum pertusum]|uniref:Cofilin n=1 Tax=Desmophyllum pertusum TaxID=174260 RepID=A0A9W9Y8M3_9CNID|nr:cofilin [Desmophyllum pertusum]
MNSSGIRVKEECVAAFNEIKDNHRWKYVIFKLSDNKQSIAVSKKVRTSTYEDFIKLFRMDECLYALYEFTYQTEDRGPASKIVFFSWTPEDSQEERMIYASSRVLFQNKISPHMPSVEATEQDDLEEENVTSRIHQKRIIRRI